MNNLLIYIHFSLLCSWKKGKPPKWKSPEIPASAARYLTIKCSSQNWMFGTFSVFVDPKTRCLEHFRVTRLRDLGQAVLSFHWDALPAHE